MEDKEFAQGNLGQVGKYDVAFKDGALVIEVDANVPVGSAGLLVKVDASKVLDAIAAAIPGKVDDAIIGIIKAALLAK
jgi:hypothetical protein